MRTMKWSTITGIGLLAVFCGATMLPAFAADEVKGFPDLERRSVTFWSDGTRVAGDLTYPKGIKTGEKLPGIVLCHGWGGTKRHLNMQIAPQFAAAGFVVLAFDYRGWGASNSRLLVTGDMPKPDEDGNVTVTAVAIREIVDPLDQQEDIDAALTFMEGESIVDKDRMGIWGSSFGGGHVVWRSAIDKRVKCAIAQVGGMDAAAGLPLAQVYQERIKRVRGDLPFFPIEVAEVPGLNGKPFSVRFALFSPVEKCDTITAPMLIIDAEEEHYFDIKENGGRVHDLLTGPHDCTVEDTSVCTAKGRVTNEYHIFKGVGHYDVYRGEAFNKTMKIEVPWMVKHLKN